MRNMNPMPKITAATVKVNLAFILILPWSRIDMVLLNLGELDNGLDI